MARIALIGPGAVGCTVLAWLGRTGAHDLIVCARTAFAQLEVETPDGTITASPRVLTEPADAQPVDWVLITTKTYDVDGVVAWLGRLRGPTTRVAVLQNGVEHVERFAPFVARDALVPVVVECPAERSAPGRVKQRGRGWMLVPETEAGCAFAALFAATALEVKTTPDWTSAAWRKLCLNAAGAVSAITSRPAGVIAVEGMADVMRGIVREVVQVGRCEGAVLDDTIVEAIITNTRSAPPDAVNSILADRLAGRRMEIDARNGVIVRLGRKHGVPTPYNEMAVALLRAADPAP